MSVEIWKGVCAGKVTTYNTEVRGFRESGTVHIIQEDDPELADPGEHLIVMDEAEAIDIALCILKELVPGFMQGKE